MIDTPTAPRPVFRRVMAAVVASAMTTASFAAAMFRRRPGPRARVLEEWRCTGCRKLIAMHALTAGVIQIVCKCNTKNTLLGADLLAELLGCDGEPVPLETRMCAGRCKRVAFEHRGLVGELDAKCLQCPTMNSYSSSVA